MHITNQDRGLEDHLSSRPASYLPPIAERNAAHWRINGYPATIFIWTAVEWELLDDQPADAQYYPCGVWCALRIDPSA